MTLHKLTAGDGYTYLIRQVAAVDASAQGTPSLAEYYTAKGESPGVWMGAGMAGVGVSGHVTEQQMKNLFGQGIHPDAERIEAEAIQQLPAKGARRAKARHVAAAVQLGRPFPIFPEVSAWRERLHDAYAEWEITHGPDLTETDKQTIRTQVGTAMFVEEHHRQPGTEQELSGYIARQSRPQTSAVAGYDLTFSPVKSVSTLWAVAPIDTAQQIEAAHDEAVQDTLSWLEKAAGYTREGTHSVAQVDAKGFLAAVFTHRDSRAGDPDLHTHVAVSNKVQTLSGKWLSLDGRMLHRMAVAASERYNTLLEAGVTQRLGVTFAPRDTTPGKRPVREIVGVPPELNGAWSSRRAAIDAAAATLQAKFLADHGRVPTATERIALHQQATLDTRQAKHEPRSLAEQRAAWREQAITVLGSPQALDDMVTDLQAPADPDVSTGITEDLVAELTAQTVDTVADSRAHWRESNLLAEALRQVRGSGVDPQAMVELARAVTDRALGLDHCIPIRTDTEISTPVPVQLQRLDGQSVFRIAGGQLYTTPAVLAAEQRLVAVAGQHGARTITTADVEIAGLEWSANNQGRQLNPAQAAMVTDLATTDRPLMLALAPAGTGKTTVMGVLSSGWQATGGTVLGLAPQASAAQELAAAIPGVDADTLDKLTYDLTRTPQAEWQPWMRAIGPETLVIIDEAGLASTPKLDTAVGFIVGRGGRVVLLGDDQQRAANGAGGVLRDIEASHGALTLTEVMRFTDPQLGHASLALREGDPSVVGFYVDRGSIHAATPTSVADQVYTAWAADTAAGADSIMIAPTLDLVGQLNAKARAGRVEAGLVTGAELTLPNGDQVAAGDVIVTKKNKRVLSLGGTDFVRNNYRWTVQQVSPDGSITATETRRGVTRTLPAWYVQQGHIRLGYAHPHASVQGMTVGRAGVRRGTAHLVVTDGMTRNDLYPGLTRAADGTTAYVVTPGTGDRHDLITPGTVLPPSVVETFSAVLGRDGTPQSVTTEMREAADPAGRLGQAADAYRRALEVAAQTQLGDQGMDALAAAAETVVPGVTAAAAWDTLHAHLALLAVSGNDPIEALAAAAGSRELDTAVDLAAVLDYRLDPTGNHSQHPGVLPWLPAIPDQLVSLPEWGPYLTGREDLVDELAGHVLDQARAFTTATAPAWALPYLTDPALLVDLALWRSSHSIPEDDLRPAGEKPRTIAAIQAHRNLVDRAVQTAGDPADGADRWATQLAHAGIDIADDDYWPVLAARLSAADAAGLPVTRLLDEAINDRAPLPTEVAAGALWWRLADRLGPDALTPVTGHRLAPAWTRHLTDTLGEHAAAQITTDRLWPVIVGRVDTYARTPHPDQASVDRVVADAAGLLAAYGPMRPSELAPHLLANLDLLLDLDDRAPDDTDMPFDPAEADLYAPAGAYALVDEHHQAAEAADERRRSPADDLDEPESATDPFDPDRYTRRRGFIDPYAGIPTTDTGDPAAADDLAEPDDFSDVEREFSDREPADEPPADLYDDAPTSDPGWVPPAEPPADDLLAEADVVDPDTTAAADLTAADRAAAVARAQAALDAAHAYWKDQAPTSWVPAYITGRGLDPAPFGYAPAGWTKTTEHLTALGFTRDEQLVAGLIRQSSRGTYIDQFRDRAMLPITQPAGPIGGFIGRANPADLSDRTPKYLNSPSTDLFNKSEMLYGLDEHAVAALRAGADLVFVEGPMDAQAINQAHRAVDGAPAALVAVAASGTALTAAHLDTLRSVAPITDRAVVVALDNDRAGQAAAGRAHQVFTRAGVEGVQTIDGLHGKDASELLEHEGPQAVRDAFSRRRSLADLVVDHTLAQHPIADGYPEDRYRALLQVAPIIARLPVDERTAQVLRVADALHADTFHVLNRVMDHVPTERPTPVPGDLGLPPRPVLRTLTDRSSHFALDTQGPAGPTPAHPDPAPDNGPDPDAAAGGPDRAAVATLDRSPEPADQLVADPRAVETRAAEVTAAAVAALDIAQPATEPDEPEVDAVAVAVAVADGPVVGARRAYGDLPDAVLAERAAQAAADLAEAARLEQVFADEAERTAAAVQAGRGYYALQVDLRIQRTRDKLAAAQQVEASDREFVKARRVVVGNVRIRLALEKERSSLGAFSGRRKADIADRLADLDTIDEEQKQKVRDLRAALDPAALKIAGTAEQRQQIRDDAAKLRAQLPTLRAQAATEDQEMVTNARFRADRAATDRTAAAAVLADLTDEQQHRELYPEPGAEQHRLDLYNAQQAEMEADEDEPWHPDLDWELPGAQPPDIGFER